LAMKSRSLEVISRGNMLKNANLATRITDFQVDIVFAYLRAAFVGV
jgi:hypothetical protein